jgi:hypothetical protein
VYIRICIVHLVWKTADMKHISGFLLRQLPIEKI